jgi:uncharacterized membrane protein YphA (DoxX/SURF4 family)
MNIKKIIYILARLAIGGMFIYTGFIHFSEPAAFAKAIDAYRILPNAFLVNLAAASMPPIEIIAGFLVVSGIFIEGGSLAISGMLLIFAVALLASLIRGLDISCGCFTTDPAAAKITWWYMLRDIGLLIVSIGIFIYPAIFSEKNQAE